MRAAVKMAVKRRGLAQRAASLRQQPERARADPGRGIRRGSCGTRKQSVTHADHSEDAGPSAMARIERPWPTLSTRRVRRTEAEARFREGRRTCKLRRSRTHLLVALFGSGLPAIATSSSRGRRASRLGAPPARVGRTGNPATRATQRFANGGASSVLQDCNAVCQSRGRKRALEWRLLNDSMLGPLSVALAHLTSGPC